MRPNSVAGYDGLGIAVGDRVELHPATDWFMRGARYATVTAVHPATNRVSAVLDNGDKRIFQTRDVRFIAVLGL